MPDAPCGRPDCPIVAPTSIDKRSLHTHVLPARTEWYRVARRAHGDDPFTPSGIGDGRFSPLADRGHCYLAAQRSASLLESALHEAAGPNPRIYTAQLRPFSLYRLRLLANVSLVDLRDPALTALGIERATLTGAAARHYPCTRAVAEHLVGAKRTAGFVWTSRQGHLHADRNPDGLASEVLHHEQLDVAVVDEPDAAGSLTIESSEPIVVGDTPIRFVRELANLLRIAIL
ncbi:MAG: RES domain-containing protein [Actinomycetota bacterium]